MKRYRVRGVYQMTFFVEADDVVEADNEEEAIEKVRADLSAWQAYDQECIWYDAGPEVFTLGDDDEE